MAKIFRQVKISCLGSDFQLEHKYEFSVIVVVDYDPQGLSIKIRKDNYGSNQELMEFPVSAGTDCSKFGSRGYIFNIDLECLVFKFNNETDARSFHANVAKVKSGKGVSVFSERTDDSSAMQYFQFYGYLSQQQNMMQDYIRTSTYQRAILANLPDFKDKVVLDVGAGSGILSFFAIQAGARKVYAVEASTMAQHAEALINANNLKGKIVVIAGKIEEIEIPESVNVIISEPMGYMLYNERMLETYLHAKKWLLPNGRMFPSRGDLHIAPFSDDTLYMEQFNKANFWYQQCFHGVDLSSLRQAAMKEYFRQPIVDTFDIRICMAKSLRHSVDFQIANETDLHKIEIPLEFHLLDSGTVHGLAFWFDVAFIGSAQTIWLSTAPTESLTHWYQVRCLLETPIFVKQGQLLTGRVLLLANKRQSYDVTIELCVEGTGTRSSNTLDLKNPYFRYTGQAPQAPPGQNTTSPSENYWSHLDAQGARQAVNMVNGISVNGLGEVSIDANQTAANLIGLGDSPRALAAWLTTVSLRFHSASLSQRNRCVFISGTSAKPLSTMQPTHAVNHLEVKKKSTSERRGNLRSNQPNIHPGSISSTGRQRVGQRTATSTQATQLIGGGISPTLFTSSTQQLVLGNTSHYPVNNSLMIGDYVTPAGVMLSTQGITPAQGYRQ